MGEIADMMMDGTLCAECGVFIDDAEEGYDGACGYPRYCRDCGGRPEMNGQKPVPGPSRGKRGGKKKRG